MKAKPVMPHELHAAIEQVVEYLADERRDFQAHLDAGHNPKNHVYCAVFALETWLQQQPRLPKELADRQPASNPFTSPSCTCGGKLVEVDSHGRSLTARCQTCSECFLVFDCHNPDPTVILLREFDQRRGEGFHRRPLDDHGMAERLLVALAADCWPSPATALDFGIESMRHYAALQEAARNGLSAYELDRVLGDGQAITKLVAAAVPESRWFVRFETAYDQLNEHFQASPPQPEPPALRHDNRFGDEPRGPINRLDDHDPEIER